MVVRAALGRATGPVERVRRGRRDEAFTTPAGKRHEHRLDATRLRLALPAPLARGARRRRRRRLPGPRRAPRRRPLARRRREPGVAAEAAGSTTRPVRARAAAGRPPARLRLSGAPAHAAAATTRCSPSRACPPAPRRATSRSARAACASRCPSGEQTARHGLAARGDRHARRPSSARTCRSRSARAVADRRHVLDPCPGRAAWSWWADSWSPRRLADQQRHVDAAAAAGWEYVLVDEGWEASWIPELVAYAAQRGVRILLWADWEDLATAARARRVPGPARGLGRRRGQARLPRVRPGAADAVHGPGGARRGRPASASSPSTA